MGWEKHTRPSITRSVAAMFDRLGYVHPTGTMNQGRKMSLKLRVPYRPVMGTNLGLVNVEH